MSEEQVAQVNLSGELTLPKKRGRKPGVPTARKKVVRLARFDLDAIRIIMAGKSVDALCLELGVDANEAAARLDALVESGYLVKSEKGYKLGVDGYNKVGYKLRSKERVEKGVVKGNAPESILSRQDTGKVDLGEMLRAGAPTAKIEAPPYVKPVVQTSIPGINSQKKKESQSVPPIPVALHEEKEKHVRAEEKDLCELCKGNFKVGGKDSNPKYAHCVCGVAYHRDCYESLIENNGKCIACGKKLPVLLEKGGEDAMKGLKNAF